ncbi:MAG TPA: hypothetical protein VK976_08295 [Verrucomicrobiae bacterium]|nr:hypothetical protein [Verrucomicrobiae bacterium]
MSDRSRVQRASAAKAILRRFGVVASQNDSSSLKSSAEEAAGRKASPVGRSGDSLLPVALVIAVAKE